MHFVASPGVAQHCMVHIAEILREQDGLHTLLCSARPVGQVSIWGPHSTVREDVSVVR